MLIPVLKTTRTLLSYLLVAYAIFSSFLPYGEVVGDLVSAFFLIQLFLIRKFDYALSTWYVLDVLACHCIHATGSKRSISGWTGQHMHRYKRYHYQAKLIDLAFGEGHCFREFQKERSMGYV